MLKNVESMKMEMDGLGIATSLVGRASKIFRHDSDLPSSVTQGCGQDTKRKTNMKKLMCAVAALSAGICLADITSANIVGYQTMPVTKSKYHAFAVQFKDVSKTDAEVAIQDLLTCSNPQGGTRVVTTVDQIHLWDGMGWIKYFYSNSLSKWVKDGEQDATTDTVKNGDTFFFLRSSKGKAGDTVTLNGEVNTVQASKEVEVTKSKYHFVAYPWPVQFEVNGFLAASSNPQGGTRVVTTVDQVHRWDGMGWIKYYYNTTLGGYVKDGESEITKDKLDAGEGVFFLRSSKGKAGDKLSFTKPAGL